MSSVSDLLPHDVGLRVDTMPPTELRDNAVAATNVYILEREANDD